LNFLPRNRFKNDKSQNANRKRFRSFKRFRRNFPSFRFDVPFFAAPNRRRFKNRRARPPPSRPIFKKSKKLAKFPRRSPRRL